MGREGYSVGLGLLGMVVSGLLWLGLLSILGQFNSTNIFIIIISCVITWIGLGLGMVMGHLYTS